MWTDSARAKYARPAKRYASDLTDAEFALIAPRLPPPCRLGRPRTTDLRAVLDAIFYLLRTGCQWAPAAQAVPTQEHGVRLFPPLVAGRHPARPVLWPAGPGRQAAGREPQPTAGIVDSQSVKTTRERRPARLRRRQEDQRPQAARPGRHAGPAAARHRPSRQHPGPRRPRPAAGPHPPPLPLASPAVRRRRLSGRGRGRGRARRSGWSWRSSSAPTRPPASSCCRGAGWSSAASPGSAATAGWPKTSRP